MTRRGRIRVGLPLAVLIAVAAPSAPAQEAEGRLDLAVCAPTNEGFSLSSTNPYFPMEVGSEWVLEGGDERVVVTVLDETETVAGVTTRVVEEREFEDGELKEVSRNFFAQASDGTVCYFGEDVDNYKDGVVVSHESEWRADNPGSRPGIIMPGDPRPGLKFVMEVAPGAAGDEGEIVEVGETITVPAGTFTGAIRLEEFDPQDDEREDKVYAKGVGILIDEDLELVSHR
ncbi:MAG TPA: hypothetical protein VJP59_01420 [Gemmatimonadota bacterium]|nr:hypothetical protein [Gemmatimonadota bacterium]